MLVSDFKLRNYYILCIFSILFMVFMESVGYAHAAQSISVRVTSSNDDAEERSSGSVDLSSSDLELVFDKSDQTIGMRFNDITIPQSATISNAYIQFQVDEKNSIEPTLLTIQGEDIDSAATFISSNGNISSRARTTTTVLWSPVPWTTVKEAGPDQQTPDIAMVIQEIVNRPGWISGNSLAVIITGTGERTAESYNGDPEGAPLLYIEYYTGPPNDPPLAGNDSASTLEDTPITIDVAANDSDPEGNLDPTTKNTACSSCAFPANGSLINNGNGSFDYTPNPNFTGADSFIYQICDTLGACDTATVNIIVTAVADPPLASSDSASTPENIAFTINVAGNDSDPDGNLDPTTANTDCPSCTFPANGALINNGNGRFDYTPNQNFIGVDSFIYQICDTLGACDTATATITVNPPAPMIVEVQVEASSDDAEEQPSGSVNLSSSDLELVFDKSDQTVGMRFNGITIPQLAIIDKAYILFQVDETSSIEPTLLTIQGEDIDNAVTFISSNGNISSRIRTTATVSWSVVPWTTVEEAGPEQQTPDIATVIQEIVNRVGWTSGNSLSVIITGTGERTAESYNGDPAGAPLLYVEYHTGPPNDPPLATNDDFTSTPVAEGGTLANLNVLVNDTDANGTIDVSTVSITGGTNGVATANLVTGLVNFTHDGSETTLASFTYTVNDNIGTASNVATVSLTVTAVNDPPVATGDVFTSTPVDEGGTLTGLTVLANDIDADGTLDVTSVMITGATNGVATADPLTGLVTFTHDGSETTYASFTYIVNDNLGAPSNEATTSLAVATANDPPVAMNDAFTSTPIAEGGTLTNLDVLANDIDVDGIIDVTTLTITGQTNGTATAQLDGTVTFTQDGIDYYVSPTGSDSNSGTLALPFKTVGHGVDQLNSGDTLYLREGTYYETVSVSRSGTSSNPIVIQSYPGEWAVIDSGTKAFRTPGNSDWVLDDASKGIYCAGSDVSWPSPGTNWGYIKGIPNYENERVELLTYTSNSYFRAADVGTGTSLGGYIGPGMYGNCIRLQKTQGLQHAEQRYGQVFPVDTPNPADYEIVWSKSDNTLTINGDYVIIKNLEVNQAKITIDLTGHDITLDGVKVWQGDRAIYAESSSAHHIKIIRSKIYDDSPKWVFWSDRKDSPHVSGSNRGTLIAMYGGAHDWEVVDSHIRGGHDLIGMNDSNYNLFVHHNRIESADDDCFEIEGTSSIGRVDIYDNYISNCLMIVSYGQGSTNVNGPLNFYHNVVALLRNPPINRKTGINGWNGGWYFGFEYGFKQKYLEARNENNFNNTYIMLNAQHGYRPLPGTQSGSTVLNNIMVMINTEVLDNLSTSGAIVEGNLYQRLQGFPTVSGSGGTGGTNAIAPASMQLFVRDLLAGHKTSSNGYDPSATGAQNAYFGEMDIPTHFVLTPENEIAKPSDFLVHTQSLICDQGDALPSGLPNASQFATWDIGVPDRGALPCGITAADLDVWPFVDDGPSNPWQQQGTVNFTHDGSETTVASFTYTVKDNLGALSNVATVSLAVTPENDPPVATDDGPLSTVEDTTLLINAATDLLANDTDVDGDSLSVSVIILPVSGTLVDNTDGTYTYTPNLNFTGVDSFTYTAADGNGGNAIATVSLTIIATNDQPVAIDDGPLLTAENAMLLITTATDLLANDTDVDGDHLSVSAVIPPASGTLVDNTDGTYTYTPNPGFIGTDSFTYTVADGNGGTANATVNLTVIAPNNPPVAMDDDISSTPVAEGFMLTNLNVLANDTDTDGMIDITSVMIIAATNGVATADSSTGLMTFTHDGSETTLASFTYTVNDNLGVPSNMATVSLLVTPVNDPPVASDDGPLLTIEDTVLLITTATDLFANDTDAEGDSLSVIAVTPPARGILVDNTDGTYTYTPKLDFTGADSFTYTAADGNGGTATATVSLTIIAANDPPVATDDDVTSTPVVKGGMLKGLSVLENDTDADGIIDITSVTIISATNGVATADSVTGLVAFTHDGTETTVASFTYTVVDDLGASSNVATVSLAVTPVTSVIGIQVAASSDDAEERETGKISLTSSDLELVFDGKDNQTVGLRFKEVAIPLGATIVDAYVQFQVDETTSVPTSLMIEGEAIDNAPTFTSSLGNISTRNRTTSSVTWLPPPWLTKEAAGPDQRTPNIAPVIQEIVNRGGWSSTNSLVIMITGTGERIAEAFDGDSNAAPVLYVEFQAGTPGNQLPTVAAGPDQTIMLPSNVLLNGSVTDDGIPNPPGIVTTTWSLVSGPGTVIFNDVTILDAMASFSHDGTYVLRLTAYDSELTMFDEVIIIVGIVSIDVRVVTSSDDAEEGASGKISLTSSDLELVNDGDDDQTIGLRFPGVMIPPGATIIDAYVQFTADETHSVVTYLTIEGEAIDNALTFTKTLGNISSRNRTSAAVAWSPVPWLSVGDAGPAQQTPSLVTIIQEIVDGGGWASSNALVLMFTGTGERVTEAFDGVPAAAPLLHVEFQVAPPGI